MCTEDQSPKPEITEKRFHELKQELFEMRQKAYRLAAALRPFCDREAIMASWKEQINIGGNMVDGEVSGPADENWDKADRFEIFVSRGQMDELAKVVNEVANE